MQVLRILLASVFATTHALAQPLIMTPEISPDGQTIAFSYQGDIWTVSSAGGRPHRLTIHDGYDANPAWSRDGRHIAFNSKRFGNDDVYLLRREGGTPTRLSYHSADDRVTGVHPDGSVLFISRRTYAQVEREWEILSVDAGGQRTEQRFLDALGFDAVVSPDGSKVAFVRGSARTEREAYRGPANRDLWLYDIASDSYSQLTRFDGNDFLPKWAGDQTLYFLSSRSGKYNVHRLALDGAIEQVTRDDGFGVTHFSVTEDGSNLVYQSGDRLYAMNPATRDLSSLSIDMATDFRRDPVVAMDVDNHIEQYAVSPNGKWTAYTIRGDLYVTRNDEEDSRSVRLTHGVARDRNPTWLNDQSLLFVSDRGGQYDLYMLTSADDGEPELFASLKHRVTALTDSEPDEAEPVVSPDGKRIVFRRGRGSLLSADIAADGKLSNLEVLVDGWDTPSRVSWSPDSRWIAYGLADLSFNEEIFIHAADNSRGPVNVSMHPKRDTDPVWSPDGSKLGFVSARNNGDDDIWFAWLRKEDAERSKEEWRRRALRARQDKDAEKASDDDADEEPSAVPAPTDIDLEGIHERLEQVTALPSNERELAFSRDGEQVYFAVGGAGRQNFQAEENLYRIQWNGKEQTTLIGENAGIRQLRPGAAGKYLYALSKGGKLQRVAAKDDKVQALAVSSKLQIEQTAELAQLFDDGWRALQAGFYDPDFHGRDWSELRAQYRPLALKASTREDFRHVFNQMLGQLNASHMGMREAAKTDIPQPPSTLQKEKTGLLGIEGRHTAAGFEITSLLPGSPADRVESQLLVGDVITAVNQEPAVDSNLYRLLTGTAETPVLLQVERDGQSLERVIWPTESLSDELYDAWVDSRRALTEDYSNGRLGYLHIRGMNWSSFERFERDLMAAGYGKQGIVIDVRYNGGGWTTDYLMAVLGVRQHAYTIPRGALDDIKADRSAFRDSYPFAERLPLSAWTRPAIALCNESSYSNAEIFSHAFKSLGIGKLVGRPTFGAVISTGSYPLVDGSYVRMPFRGWWVKASDANMEGTPAVPDIEVSNPPAYKARNTDPQLQRAVQALLEEL
jgi:Tol biopolymer transport system component